VSTARGTRSPMSHRTYLVYPLSVSTCLVLPFFLPSISDTCCSNINASCFGPSEDRAVLVQGRDRRLRGRVHALIVRNDRHIARQHPGRIYVTPMSENRTEPQASEGCQWIPCGDQLHDEVVLPRNKFFSIYLPSAVFGRPIPNIEGDTSIAPLLRGRCATAQPPRSARPDSDYLHPIFALCILDSG
jgi:hypothetical protein